MVLTEKPPYTHNLRELMSILCRLSAFTTCLSFRLVTCFQQAVPWLLEQNFGACESCHTFLDNQKGLWNGLSLWQVSSLMSGQFFAVTN